jgi:hypothetical protein
MTEEHDAAPQLECSERDLDEWVAVLHPERAVEAHASEAERRLARWVRDIALEAARDLLPADAVE